MSNPYASPSHVGRSQESHHSGRVSPVTLLRRVFCFVGFACGSVLTAHAIVAFQQGPAEAIFRSVRQPLAAMGFFAFGVSACFAAAAGWKFLRSRLFSGYVATPLTQFATGIVLVASFPFVRSILLWVSLPMSDGMRGTNADLMHALAGLCALVVAAVVAIELEALLVRIRNHGRSRSGRS